MGLRCLLGHEYANREVEREREERGNEVVVTYRTVEACDRCGERRVVSENKEVRPVRNPEDETVATGLGGGVTPAPEGEADTPESSEVDADDETATETPAATASEASPDETAADETPAEEASPDETTDDPDGGIILDDDGDGDDEPAGDRGHGEWPEADSADAEPAETDDSSEVDAVDDGATVVTGEGWPEPDGEDEGFDAETSNGETMDVEFGGGLTPEERAETKSDADAAGSESAAAAATDGAAGKQFVAAEGVERVDEEASETEFFCPNCGYARVAGGSSMRAGDICPDCHKGYIAEREQ